MKYGRRRRKGIKRDPLRWRKNYMVEVAGPFVESRPKRFGPFRCFEAERVAGDLFLQYDKTRAVRIIPC